MSKGLINVHVCYVCVYTHPLSLLRGDRVPDVALLLEQSSDDLGVLGQGHVLQGAEESEVE